VARVLRGTRTSFLEQTCVGDASVGAETPRNASQRQILFLRASTIAMDPDVLGLPPGDGWLLLCEWIALALLVAPRTTLVWRSAMAIRRRTGPYRGCDRRVTLVRYYLSLHPALIRVDRLPAPGDLTISRREQQAGRIGRLGLTFFPVTIHIDHFGREESSVISGRLSSSKWRGSMLS